MAHRPEFIAPETRATLFKLLAGVAALSLTTACTPSAKKLLTQSRMPSPVIAQKPPKKPLSPKNPLHVATAYWGKVYQQKPNDPRAAVNYAKNLKAMGSTGKAYAVLKQAALAHPEDREIASELGRLALARGELHLARTYLKMAERTDGKTDWRVLSALGTLHAKQGHHKQAQDYFRAALRRNPGAPSLQNNLALSLAMSGKPAEAEQLLRKTVASGYDTPRVRQNLALVLGLQRKFSEAKQVASLDLPQERVSANIDLLRNIVSTRSLAQSESPAPRSDPGRRLAALGKPAKAKGASDRTGAGTPPPPPLPERKAAHSRPAGIAEAAAPPRQTAELNSTTKPLPWAKDRAQTQESHLLQPKREGGGAAAMALPERKPASAPAPQPPERAKPAAPGGGWTATIAQADSGARAEAARTRSRIVLHSSD